MKNRHALLIAFLIVGASLVVAQQIGPSNINGCIYFATPPSLTDLQQYPYVCDSTGRLLMSGVGPPPVGCGTGVIDASAGCPLPMLGM